jgi:hypothetical protein
LLCFKLFEHLRGTQEITNNDEVRGSGKKRDSQARRKVSLRASA